MIHLHRKRIMIQNNIMSTVPEYRAPDISYQKKPLDMSSSSSKTRKCRNVPNTQVPYNNVTVDDLLPLSFPLSEAVDFMETGKTFYIPSTQQICKRQSQVSMPLHAEYGFLL